jgi:hypothetical protein
MEFVPLGEELPALVVETEEDIYYSPEPMQAEFVGYVKDATHVRVISIEPKEVVLGIRIGNNPEHVEHLRKGQAVHCSWQLTGSINKERNGR